MVKYVSQYNVLVQNIHASDAYKNATNAERQEVDEWLNSENIKNYLGSKLVPKLTLRESFVLMVANSEALQHKTPDKRQRAIEFAGSDAFGEGLDGLERSVSQLFGI